MCVRLLAPCRFITALAFSGDGNRLVIVTADNRHTVYVYLWRSKQLISQNVGYNGQPPSVRLRAWWRLLPSCSGPQAHRKPHFLSCVEMHVEGGQQVLALQLRGQCGAAVGLAQPG